jgi:hypothetical protein
MADDGRVCGGNRQRFVTLSATSVLTISRFLLQGYDELIDLYGLAKSLPPPPAPTCTRRHVVQRSRASIALAEKLREIESASRRQQVITLG